VSIVSLMTVGHSAKERMSGLMKRRMVMSSFVHHSPLWGFQLVLCGSPVNHQMRTIPTVLSDILQSAMIDSSL
jgi:hypothetical protein